LPPKANSFREEERRPLEAGLVDRETGQGVPVEPKDLDFVA
jgi:hypothetical protein